MDQTVNAFLDLNKDTEVGEVTNLSPVAGTHSVLGLYVSPRISLELLDTEAHLTLSAVESEDNSIYLVANLQEVVSGTEVLAPAHLRYVNKTLNAFCDLNECSVISHYDYLTVNLVAYFEVRIKRIPRVRSQLLETERDTFLLLIEVEDNDVDLLVELQQLVRVVYAAPAEVGNMNETVHTTEVDEYAVVGDVLNGTLEYLTLLELADDLSLLSLEFSLDKCFVRNNDVAELRIQFNDLELHGLAYEDVVVTNRLHVDLAAREECFHTEYVHDHAAFRTPFDVTGNDLTCVVSLVNAVPSFSSTCLIVRKNELSFFVLLALDVDFYFVAYLEVRVVTELRSRNDTVGFVTYVDNYLTLVDTDDSTLNDFVVLDGAQRVVILLDFFFVFCALLLCFIGIPVEVLERKIFCHVVEFCGK